MPSNNKQYFYSQETIKFVKSIISFGSITFLLMLILQSSNAVAVTDSATITINGKVLANTCTIDANSAKQDISLPNVSDRQINGVGKTAGSKDVIIILKNCGASSSKVLIKVYGTTDVNDATAFSNSVANGAEGVGLYFYQTDGETKFSPDGSVSESYNITPSSDNSLTFKAIYVGTSDTIKAGDFSTVINMTFDYS